VDATATKFDRINRNAQVYPANVLPSGGTALCLFSAGFLGWNDVIHMVRSEMRVTCVDVDKDKLFEMATIYPAGLELHVEDAWEFANEAATAGRTWDVVSVDPYMGNAAEKAWETRSIWTLLADNIVTLTVAADRELFAPPGWSSYMFPRNEKVSWMVMQRDA
jgi:hypothetical protein